MFRLCFLMYLFSTYEICIDCALSHMSVLFQGGTTLGLAFHDSGRKVVRNICRNAVGRADEVQSYIRHHPYDKLCSQSFTTLIL